MQYLVIHFIGDIFLNYTIAIKLSIFLYDPDFQSNEI